MGNARFSLPLQREARAQGEDHQAVRWLLSDGIQEALCAAAEGCLQTSLPAERALATAKHGEQSRLCHLATRSRDLIHRAVLRKRDRAVAQLEAAERALRASKKTRIEHIAFQAYSGPTGAWLPAASRYSVEPEAPGTKAAAAPGTQAAAAPDSAAPAAPENTAAATPGKTAPPSRTAFAAFVRQHGARFRRTLAEERKKAEEAVRRSLHLVPSHMVGV